MRERLLLELRISKVLADKLNGSCGDDCPKGIERVLLHQDYHYVGMWTCEMCAKMCDGVMDIRLAAHPCNDTNQCPCDNLGQEAIVVLEEHIANLTKKEILTRQFNLHI